MFARISNEFARVCYPPILCLLLMMKKII